MDLGSVKALLQTQETIEVALQDVAVEMCRAESIDVKGKKLGEIREIVKEHGLKLRQHAKKGMGKYDLVVVIYLHNSGKLLQVGRVTLNLDIEKQDDAEEWNIRVEGGMLTPEGVAEANEGFEKWVSKNASI